MMFRRVSHRVIVIGCAGVIISPVTGSTTGDVMPFLFGPA
jgi:hypothetical protein